jgi:hypothetical protein
VKSVKAAAPRHGKSLAHAQLVAIRPGEVVVSFTNDAAFHRLTVTGAAGKSTVEKALQEHFARPTRLVEEGSRASSLGPSLAEEEARDRAVREKDIGERVRLHPAVRSALRILGGELEHVQVLEAEATALPNREPTDDHA